MADKPYDRLEGVIWYDGRLVPWGDANVHVLTHGLHYASSRVRGRARLWRRNLQVHRAFRAPAGNRPKSSISRSPIRVAEIDAAKRWCSKRTARGRLCAADRLARQEMMGVSAQNNTIHLAIASWQWPSYFDPAQKLKGIRLDIAEYRRPDPRTAPALAKAAGLYMICTISKHRAERKGYADALMLDWQGRVAECTGANIFFVETARSTPRSPIASWTGSPGGPSSTWPRVAEWRSWNAEFCPTN